MVVEKSQKEHPARPVFYCAAFVQRTLWPQVTLSDRTLPFSSQWMRRRNCAAEAVLRHPERAEDAVFLERRHVITTRQKKNVFPTLHFSAAYLAAAMHVRVTLCDARGRVV